MGTTLTGTTPQDTYDSLIKVTDNGPLSGSLKVLTDGLGNNSALSLSTAAASVTGTLAVTTGTNLATSSGSVGIGLSSPTAKLEIQDAAAGAAVKVSNTGGGSAQLAISSNATSIATLSFTNSLTISGGDVGIGAAPNAKLNVIGEISQNDYSTATNSVFSQRSSNAIFSVTTTGTTGAAGTDIAYSWANGGQGPLTFSRAAGEVMRLSSDGYMRMAASTGGIQFNGDTAAANALDDYEEGTFTATLVPSTSGSITLSSSFQTALYTKIGRQVTVRGYLVTQSVSSPVGGGIFLRGLPFTANGGGAASVSFFDAPTYAASNLVSYIRTATTQIEIVQSAALVGNDEEYYFTATYFV